MLELLNEFKKNENESCNVDFDFESCPCDGLYVAPCGCTGEFVDMMSIK